MKNNPEAFRQCFEYGIHLKKLGVVLYIDYESCI